MWWIICSCQNAAIYVYFCHKSEKTVKSFKNHYKCNPLSNMNILHKYNLLETMNWRYFSFITYHTSTIFSFITLNEVNIAINHEGKPFKCEICDKIFQRKYKLKKHITIVHDENLSNVRFVIKFWSDDIITVIQTFNTFKISFYCMEFPVK